MYTHTALIDVYFTPCILIPLVFLLLKFALCPCHLYPKSKPIFDRKSKKKKKTQALV